MPILDNPRYEAFAQARARGARLDDAYEDAGFAPGHGHASRVALRPEVAERIAELRALQEGLEAAGAQAVIAALLRLAKAGETPTSPAAMREFRLTLIEVDRLRERLEFLRASDRIATLSSRHNP